MNGSLCEGRTYRNWKFFAHFITLQECFLREYLKFGRLIVLNMSDSSPRNKQQIVDEIHELIGLPLEPLGPGSKERKSTLVSIARAIGLPIATSESKNELARRIIIGLDGIWDSACFSAGDTITGAGFLRILEGLTNWLGGNEIIGNVDEASEGTSTYDEMDDDRNSSEIAIAEQLASFSSADVSPTEFELNISPFLPSEVDFQSTNWMECLMSVQGFLRFSPELTTESPEKFLSALTVNLGESPSTPENSRNLLLNRLSNSLLEKLRDWVERASYHYEAFLEEIEQGNSREIATRKWLEAWEDEIQEEGSGPVSASTGTMSISELSDRAKLRKLNLSPSYQRGDVWPTKDSQMLIESVLRGIPLPSLIFLAPDSSVGSQYEVVDGRQRLTAILRFIGSHPVALEIIKKMDEQYPQQGLIEAFKSDYPLFKKKWKSLTGQTLTSEDERELCFPFKLRKGKTAFGRELELLEGKYYSEIRQLEIPIGDSTGHVYEIFEFSAAYKLPVIEYSKASTKQIHEVFNLYNRQGKHLNAEEIRNAVFHSLDMMKALIVCSGDNPYVDDTAPFLATSWSSLNRISENLDDFKFGTARYRRSKVLSWVIATLVCDSRSSDTGVVAVKSTAMQIEALLKRIDDNPRDKLREQSKILSLMELVADGLSFHSAVPEAWDPKFMDTANGTKWQELQLIGSLVGVILATAVLGDEVEDLLVLKAAELRAISKKLWLRPKKTQSRSQWIHIAKVSIGILEVLEVDPVEASKKLELHYGQSGVHVLMALKDESLS